MFQVAIFSFTGSPRASLPTTRFIEHGRCLAARRIAPRITRDKRRNRRKYRSLIGSHFSRRDLVAGSKKR
jgi:hypothetical protein